MIVKIGCKFCKFKCTAKRQRVGKFFKALDQFYYLSKYENTHFLGTDLLLKNQNI